MDTRRFVAAAVQVCSGSSKAENLDKVETLVATAATHGARLVVLPEVFLWRGPRPEERSAAEPIPGPTTARLGALARQLQIYLVGGSILEVSSGPRVYNTSVLFDPRGDLVASYRKLHLFDVDIAGHVSIRESDTRAPGDAVVTAVTSLGTLGMTVCYDLRFPELYRRLTFAGAEIITIPSAFTFPTGAAHWELLVRARAVENQVYVIAADQIGRSPTGMVDFGHSMIVDPWGTILSEVPRGTGFICSGIDPDYLRSVRRNFPVIAHRRLK